jgi:hypothetical protein
MLLGNLYILNNTSISLDSLRNFAKYNLLTTIPETWKKGDVKYIALTHSCALYITHDKAQECRVLNTFSAYSGYAGRSRFTEILAKPLAF